jgi:hypothetical protein
MKMRMLIVTLLSAFVVVSSHAQDYDFKVLVTKGKNEFKSGAAWDALKVGTSLKKNDEIKVGANAYLGLIHASGKPIELKEAKTYKVADLVPKVGAGPSVLNKYTDFIISSNTQKRNNLTATGAVHRGPNNIRVFLPKSELAFAYGDSITIQWEKDKASAPYVVTFTSFFGDELYKTEVTTNSVTININSPAFASESEFQVQVVSKKEGKQSEQYTIRKVKKDERARVKPLLTDVLSQTKDNTAINKLWQAGFFEKEKLFIDAATAYQRAVKLEPSLQQAYDEFLISNGMNEPPKKK